MDGIIYTIIIGAVCGYIADVLMSDNGYGLLVSIIIGIAGSFVGSWAFGELGIKVGSGVVSDIIRGASGAILILFILGLFKRGTRRRS
ncbi:MAG: GlsB/YeaQ/YmgE family stress response membrane protein [Polaribacter sp.]|nr:GlsB/YeaQ/YmgE family stress response membrane protein [Polaribacter sp.]